MRRNERGISLIVLVIAIVLMAVLVAVGVVLVLNKQDNKIEKEDSTKFLKDMKEVTYVNLEYSGKTVELDNELAEILLDVDSDSIKGKSLSKTEHATGEQAYSFIFFNEDDEELYRIQFTKSSEEICIWKQDDSSNIKLYYIDNEEVLEYITDEVRDFTDAYIYIDPEVVQTGELLSFDGKIKITFNIPDGYKLSAMSESSKTLSNNEVYIDLDISSIKFNKQEEALNDYVKYLEEDDEYENVKLSEFETITIKNNTFKKAVIEYDRILSGNTTKESISQCWTQVTDEVLLMIKITNYNKMEQEDLEELLTMSFSNSVKETPNEDIKINLTEEEKQNLNYEELTEDIISLEKGEGIVNAKLVEDETPLKWIYIGEGYTIEEGGGGDCIEYIFKSNEKTIYRYTKLVPLTEIN